VGPFAIKSVLSTAVDNCTFVLKLIHSVFRKFKTYTFVQITCTFVNVKAAIAER